MQYAIEQRLRLIDFLLANYGTINRSVLMDYYGISTPQASRDIRDYIALAPDNIEYSKVDKHYRRTAKFKRYFD
jgi:hypothetical protein